MTVKKLVVVIFGGLSVEHEISIITGLQIIENLDQTKYELFPIYWSKENKFLTCSGFRNSKEIIKNIISQKVEVTWDFSNKRIILKKGLISSKTIVPDVIIPAMHGSFGEDGSLQGLLDIFGVPYVGSNVGASFLSMDKNIFKNVMKANGINILPWQTATRDDSRDFKVEFEFPVICKPNSLGSSIGVAKCKTQKELRKALDVIFELDESAIIEPFVEKMIEVNCAVLGNPKNQRVSVCERPLTKSEVLNYEEKYLKGSKAKGGMKTFGMASFDRKIPADIPQNLSVSIQEVSKKIFRILGCSGVARIDYIVPEAKRDFYVNEINPIPGSYAYYLWEASGISFTELLDEVITIAQENFEERNRIKRSFESPVLEKFLED